MTAGGWVFMIISWSVIISLMAFCYYKTLTLGGKKEKQ